MQIVLPKNIFIIYSLFEKAKLLEWKDNPFKEYKIELKNPYPNISIKLATNINNLNYYTVDFPFNQKIAPRYVMQYIKDINLRNYYSDPSLSYAITKRLNNNIWIEEEMYNNNTTEFNCTSSTFEFICYNNMDNMDSKNMYDFKLYNAYKILTTNDNYILRFEIVLNTMDIDQEIDLAVYIGMITNIMNAIKDKFVKK